MLVSFYCVSVYCSLRFTALLLYQIKLHVGTEDETKDCCYTAIWNMSTGLDGRKCDELCDGVFNEVNKSN